MKGYLAFLCMATLACDSETGRHEAVVEHAEAKALPSGTAAGKREPLFDAIHNHRATEALALIADGADVTATDEADMTPLMLAARSGQIEVVKALLDSGARLDVVNSKGQTALDFTADPVQLDVARLLVARGAGDEETLKRFRKDGHLKLAALISARMTTPKKVAKALGERDIVRLLETSIDSRDGDERTALMLAAKRGHYELICILLENGADVNLIDKQGFSALWWAVLNDRTEIARLLIKVGANSNLRAKGYSLLRQAVHSEHIDMVEVLIQAEPESGAIFESCTAMNIALNARLRDALRPVCGEQQP